MKAQNARLFSCACSPGLHAALSGLVVGASSHCFDKVNVRVLSALTAGRVRIAPHDDFADLVQDSKCPFKFPPSLLTTFIREVPLQQLQAIHCHILEVKRAFRGDVTHTTGALQWG